MSTSKEQRLNEAYSELLAIKSRIAGSDEHAIKCAKLGVSFAELYPDEATEYQRAIEDYNAKEAQIRAIQAEEEEEPTIETDSEV